MSLNIKVTFDNDLSKEIEKFRLEQTKEIDGAIKDSALMVEATTKKKISQGSRSGRIYRVRGGLHQAGADGEPPKTDTGRLVNSITHKFDFLKAEVGTDVHYAVYLEEGAYGVIHPFLKPSLEENQQNINRLVESAIKRALSK